MNYEKIRNELFNRMKDVDFIGYDPSSLKFDDKVIKIEKNIKKIRPYFLRKKIKSLFYRFIFHFGEFAHFIINPQKKTYSKGVALCLSALSFIKNRNCTSDKEKLIKILLEKRIPDTYLWSHDINYTFPCGTLIDYETPNLVTTAFVANSFVDLYVSSGKKEFLNIFNKIIEDVLKNIPYKKINEQEICFMYTSKTNYHVHNANLLYTELLAKYISFNNLINKRKDIMGLINKSISYTLNDFKRTNTFPYAGPPTENDSIDNYHTGYVLRSLNEINKCLSGNIINHNLNYWVKKILYFYIENFVGDYIYHSKDRTIETHSLAEAIIIYSSFQDLLPDCFRNNYLKSINRTIELLWDDNTKYFYNKISKVLFLKIYDRTEMIRWSNSWMFYALSLLLRNSKEILK